MENTYLIEGMTCKSCVAKVKQALETIDVVENATIQLNAPQGKLSSQKPLDINILQSAIGKYTIQEVKNPNINSESPIDLPAKSWTTYQPLLLIVAFLVGVCLLVQYPFNDFSGMLWMRHFMAGFFLVFAFFKLLNIEGFANSYRMYDLIAERWTGWGYIYPFVELGLGILYLINIVPVFTSILTIVILGISSLGVIKSNWNQEQIKCACLGDVFNLPMSTVTIVEDLSMLLMAGLMLWLA